LYQYTKELGVFDVHGVRGAVIVTLGDQLYALEQGRLLPIPMDIGTQQLGMLRVRPTYVTVHSVSGRYPGELWVRASGEWFSDGARLLSPWEGMYRQLGDAWVEVSSAAHDLVVPWSAGRTLAWGSRGLQIVSEGTSAELPVQRAGKSGKARVGIEHLAALPSDELYALGEDADRPPARAIEHFTDANSLGIHELPGWFCNDAGAKRKDQRPLATILASSPQSVFALCSSNLELGIIRFDGRVVRPIAPPTSGELQSAAVGDDGRLWLVTSSAAFVLSAADEWSRLLPPSPAALEHKVDGSSSKPSAPSRLQLSSVATMSSGHALIAGTLYNSDAPHSTWLLTTDHFTLTVPDLQDSARAAGTAPSASAASGAPPSVEGALLTPNCKTPFVILYSVSASAPADYGYPATRDALASANTKPEAVFVEFNYKQQRTLGAKVPNEGQAKVLIDLITARLKGSKPTAVCLDPAGAVIRELKL
jgi:hypothetical protein